ncbi:Glycerophosphodiester phosphodiesterase [Mycobacterium talmoniae]|uniref:Glycerophosphodiester phosphodiesterase n=1 Tax=Mycobacterium talmoniae TaxID=1858794 RepID=A0A2S8BRW8_9MYCO|nr:glycerophosphodiester phosphodiesterase [Mycobacterium eburneum]PQM49386.1 Glycerophosphodiester phosphodiesterase [Mycobacterium talmoniae]TDH51396.1 glycerophosphodiester phosphodiesterase [Mycobacterium eburneum]
MWALALAPTAAAQPSDFDLQAHRGGRGETTESSLQAFAKALEIGVSTLEFDIVITKDRQPLVWHDPTIQPDKCVDTAPLFAGDPQYPYVGKRVHDLTLAQLRTLDCDLPLEDFPEAEPVHGNTLATLPEVFALTDSRHARVRYNIETKLDAAHPDDSAPPEEFVEVILAAVRAAGKVDRVEVESFDWRTLPMVRRAEPSIPLVALWDETAVGDPMLAALAAGANIVAPEYPQVDGVFVDRAHALGLKVIPWTVNDPDTMRAQITAGVDGLITDYPTRLRTVLAELGLPLPLAPR